MIILGGILFLSIAFLLVYGSYKFADFLEAKFEWDSNICFAANLIIVAIMSFCIVLQFAL